jgi:hypothetical protein
MLVAASGSRASSGPGHPPEYARPLDLRDKNGDPLVKWNTKSIPPDALLFREYGDDEVPGGRGHDVSGGDPGVTRSMADPRPTISAPGRRTGAVSEPGPAPSGHLLEGRDKFCHANTTTPEGPARSRPVRPPDRVMCIGRWALHRGIHLQ